MNSLDSLEGVEDDGVIKDEDGKYKTFMVKVSGTSFYCSCGCNCFHKRYGEPNRFICNACEAEYVSS